MNVQDYINCFLVIMALLDSVREGINKTDERGYK